MRFLADENFPQGAVAALRSHGHDVAWVRLAAPGMADREILRWAMREERILHAPAPLTFFDTAASPSPDGVL
jgi:predicted nuclease of predicted toxin-antitoxin system